MAQKYESSKREEHHKKLQMTLSICNSNVDTARAKVIQYQQKLSMAEKELEERQKSQAVAENALRDFYGSLEGNVKNL